MPRPGTAGTSGAGFESVALGWLGRPTTCLAIVVLVINDHVLKAMFPGVVTGKLSDAAGLMVAPPATAAVLAPLLRMMGLRLGPCGAARVAAAITVGYGVGFALVKTSDAGASAASQLWSVIAGPSLVRADPTDLMALAALGLTWWTWTRARRRPCPARIVRAFRALVIVPGAVVALAATSSQPDLDATGVMPWGKSIVVDIGGYREYIATSDDGSSWRGLGPDEARRFESEVLNKVVRPSIGGCLAADRSLCYRVASGRLRVEQSNDDGRTWITAWEISEGRRKFLRRGYGLWTESATVKSVSLAVQSADNGHVVIVANREDGVLVRDTAGRWRRIGFPARSPTAAATGAETQPAASLTEDGERIVMEYNFGYVVGALVFLAAAQVARRRSVRRVAASREFLLAVAGLAATAAFLVAPTPIDTLPLMAGFAAALAGIILVICQRPRLRWWRWLLNAAIALTVGSLASGPFIGWTTGAPDRYTDASHQSLILLTLGALAAVATAWITAGPPAAAGPPPTTPAPADTPPPPGEGGS
jgi:hypothetical protein